MQPYTTEKPQVLHTDMCADIPSVPNICETDLFKTI